MPTRRVPFRLVTFTVPIRLMLSSAVRCRAARAHLGLRLGSCAGMDSGAGHVRARRGLGRRLNATKSRQAAVQVRRKLGGRASPDAG